MNKYLVILLVIVLLYILYVAFNPANPKSIQNRKLDAEDRQKKRDELQLRFDKDVENHVKSMCHFVDTTTYSGVGSVLNFGIQSQNAIRKKFYDMFQQSYSDSIKNGTNVRLDNYTADLIIDGKMPYNVIKIWEAIAGTPYPYNLSKMLKCGTDLK